MAAAAAFGTAGFSVICIDPAPPITERDAVGADLRSTAMLQPARQILQDAGVWNLLEEHAAPLQIMRIIDAGGPDGAPRATKDFNADEISDAPFGWNFPNWLLRRVLVERLAALETVVFRPGAAATSLFTRQAHAKIGLSTGETVTARLVIAADGRESAMRTAAGIDVRTRRYGQKALAFAVTHSIPHENVSTEIHRTGGPFTLVPLPDYEGKPSSAVVWMDESAATLARESAAVEEFEAEMTTRSCGVLGPLTLASARTVWPIISQHATRLTAQRVALIAEAAHVLPPIGAQGLNLSLKDVATLLDLARQKPETVGDEAMLDAYQSARYGDIQIRLNGIDLLNRISQARAPLARDVRAVGLDALYALPQVRRMLMQMGLGLR